MSDNAELTFKGCFGSGVTATIRVPKSPPVQGGSHIRGVEWTGRPRHKHIRRYVDWTNTVNQQLADEWQLKLMHVFQTRPRRITSRRLRSRGPFLKVNHLWALQKSWNLGHLETWEGRPTTTPTKPTGPLAPTTPESGKGSKTRTRPEYVGKARDYEMDFPLTHADCAGAGFYVFTKRRGPG